MFSFHVLLWLKITGNIKLLANLHFCYFNSVFPKLRKKKMCNPKIFSSNHSRSWCWHYVGHITFGRVMLTCHKVGVNFTAQLKSSLISKHFLSRCAPKSLRKLVFIQFFLKSLDIYFKCLSFFLFFFSKG